MAHSRSFKRRVTLAGVTTAATVVALRWSSSWNWQDFPRVVDLAFQSTPALPLSQAQSTAQRHCLTDLPLQYIGAARERPAWQSVSHWRVMGPWRRDTACQATAGQNGAEQREWKDAYELEIERNCVLREQFSEQLSSLGKPSAEPAVAWDPEACGDDWSQNYERLAACNNALAEEIAGLQRKAADDRPAVVAKRPMLFKINMPNDDSSMSIELLPFFGGAFYSLCTGFPVGLKLTKVDEGSLMGAFLVEELVEGGSAAVAGEVMAGDVLHAVTGVGDQADLGMRTEDFVSSLVGGLGRFRQSLMDASFIDTTDDLEDMMRSNLALGSDTKLALIFERDVNTLAPPAKPLQPESSA